MLRDFIVFRLCALLVCVILAAALVVVEACSWLVREGKRAAQTTAFNPHMGEYLRPPHPLPPGQPRPVARGGFLPINLDREVVDELYLSLPPEMRAARPEEVNTVAWVSRGRRPVGMARRGEPAYQKTCQVTVIDYPSGLLLAETEFLGARPMGNESYGVAPSDQNVVAYLYTLLSPPKPAKQAPKKPLVPAPAAGAS
jgi:hypothetical protein